MICPNCGNNLNDESQFCDNCGTKKPIVTVCRGVCDLIYQYHGELNYCPNCGAKMDKKEEENGEIH